jgi:hypothetical protein
MNVRKCEHDQSQAKYACTTHNAYYCELHYKQHISDRKPHSIFAVDNALAQPEFEQLQIETIKRIHALEQAKNQVASQTAQIIANIRQTCIATMENINSLIKSYRAYMIENNFDQQALNNITKMLTTRLQIQIGQDLAINLREESEEESKSPLKQPIRVAERDLPKKPIREEEKSSLLKQTIREAERELQEESKRETSSEQQAKQIPSNRIIRKYSKSSRQN